MTDDVRSSRIVARPTPAQVAEDWDRIALARQRQFDELSDISVRHVIEPAILGALRELKARGHAIDVGCGSGHLTRALAEFSARPIGIDPSQMSIAMAKSEHPEVATYLAVTAEEFAQNRQAEFDLLVSSMVLMDTPDIDLFLSSCAAILRDGGLAGFTTVHPFFWPKYWGYDEEAWFDYRHELFVRGPFRTSVAQLDHETTHAHRPLEMQVRAMVTAGFEVLAIDELWPDKAAARLYERVWEYPRFLMFVVKRKARRQSDLIDPRG